MLSIVIILIWISLVCEGIYGLVKGYFRREKDEGKQHEPIAYRKWVKISSVCLILCGVINVVWSVFDAFSEASSFKYILYILITVAVFIAAIAIAYVRIVKAADKKIK